MTKKAQRNIQQDVKESAHKIWLAGLGALATAEEEGTKLFKSLVEKGEEFENRGRKQFRVVRGKVQDARDRAESTLGKFGETFDEKVAATLKRLGVPTLDEIQKLTRRVEELTEKVDELNKPAAKKSSKKS